MPVRACVRTRRDGCRRFRPPLHHLSSGPPPKGVYACMYPTTTRQRERLVPTPTPASQLRKRIRGHATPRHAMLAFTEELRRIIIISKWIRTLILMSCSSSSSGVCVCTCCCSFDPASTQERTRTTDRQRPDCADHHHLLTYSIKRHLCSFVRRTPLGR